MSRNINCCQSKFDFAKKPRTLSITSSIHRKIRNSIRSGSNAQAVRLK